MATKTISAEEPVTGSNDLPEGWAFSTLGEIGEYMNGRAFKTTEWSDRGRPIIRIQDLTGTRENPNYFVGKVEDRYIVQPADLLISWSATLGAYIWNGPEGVLNQHIFKVRSHILKDFHYRLTQYIIDDLYRETHGSGMVHITKSHFDEIPVPLPPLLEQSRIVAKLEELLTNVNASGEHLAKVPKILKAFRQSVLAAACSGRLTEDWRTEHLGNTQILSESDEGSLAPTWSDSCLGDVIESSFYGPRFGADAYSPDGIPTIRTSDMGFDGSIKLDDSPRIRLTAEEFQRFALSDGDLLITRTGATIGKCAIYRSTLGPAIPSAYLIRFRFCRALVNPIYVFLFFMSRKGQSMLIGGTTAVAQPNVNAKTISAFSVPLPLLNEQNEIVRRVEALFKLADTIKKRVEAATKRADKITQAILAKAFRGELVPTEAELARRDGRDYEPASALLDRIRAARQAETGKQSTARRARTKRRK